jgi:hypothetical protein
MRNCAATIPTPKPAAAESAVLTPFPLVSDAPAKPSPLAVRSTPC